jgi:16S rRNA (cytosine1402-N4)-methyltransferase
LQCGDESYARNIARVIVTSRTTNPIKTTFQLRDLIYKALPSSAFRQYRYKRQIDPATKTFMAFRIYVNQEVSISIFLVYGYLILIILAGAIERRITSCF